MSYSDLPDEFHKKNSEVLKKYYTKNLHQIDITFYNVYDFFANTSQNFPDKAALTYNDRTITYQELEELSNIFALNLSKNGAKKGQKIGIYLERSIEYPICLLAILKLGGVFVPIDAHTPIERTALILEDSEASILISTENLYSSLQIELKCLFIESLYKNSPSISQTSLEISLSDEAYMIYTSGSTGLPKGVLLTHGNLLNLLHSAHQTPGINPNDRLLAITSFSFDVSIMEILLPLCYGSELIIANQETIKDGRLLLSFLEEKKITMLHSTPGTYRMLINIGWKKKLPIKLITGGEALSNDLANQLLDLSDGLWNEYGPTETTIFSSIKRITQNLQKLTIGSPIHNTSIYIIDKNLNLLPPGQKGEIVIGGAGVSKGYWKKDELNKEKFIQSPFSIGNEIIYKTGDLGSLTEDGEVLFGGRMDSQVKIRGHRIELEEIENQIIRLNNIKSAVITAPSNSIGIKVLVAYIIMDFDKEISDHQLSIWKSKLEKLLPDYMVPQFWIKIKKIPLTQNGKTDFKALPNPFQREADKTDGSILLSDKEKAVREIWSQVLGIKHIKANDDFFKLGGNSILAVELMAKIDQMTEHYYPLTTIFRNPTLEKFCELLNSNEKSKQEYRFWKSLTPIKPSGSLPPLYLIHGINANITNYFNLVDHVSPEQPLFGLQAKGLDGAEKPIFGIENIAAHYINEILEHNPKGPYLLGGYSFGGYVAYEMARQLINMNKEVSHLILFDTDVLYQEKNYRGNWGKTKKYISNLLDKRIVDIKLLFQSPKTFKVTKQRVLERKLKKLLPKVIEPTNVRKVIFDEVKTVNLNSIKAYKIKPLDLNIYLFRARIKISPIKDKNTYGWKPYVKSIIPVDIDGDHNTMFNFPNVKTLGNILQKIINN
ncbi:amino acid adenylation domain-containing protein [Echinicola sp. CAU 1574]|uniref:Amino acid adenylation domain-containing protein n=1 Tax=Echinicola arenosa TaxID=2774144 RepID=A0ABR9AFL6_9BACT|nr:amino acid adenylation domain-containing protein [Echinicola arenosa]MBD8487635.1 amino acid adenylation domain-containing protein [Echinicola arenosa]